AATMCPPHSGPMTAVSARKNGGRSECGRLREPMTLDDVMNSPVLWDPIRYGETCPSSDGACALVIGAEDVARRTPHKPAWTRSGASYAAAMWAPGRDQVSPRAGETCAKAGY